MRYALLVLLLLLVCVPVVRAQAVCEITGPVSDDIVSSAGLTGAADHVQETSGVVMSDYDNNILYTNDDDGDESWIYAIGRETGNVICAFDVDQPENGRDIEDIAYGPGPIPGEKYVYLGDFGSNSGSPATPLCGPSEACRVQYIWRVKESDMVADYLAATGNTFSGSLPHDDGGTIMMADAKTQRMKIKMPTDLNGTSNYDQDIESMFVDPLSNGDIYILTKRFDSAGESKLLMIAAEDQTWGRSGADPILAWTKVADATLTGADGTHATGADITRDGSLIGVTDNSGGFAYFFVREPGETVAQAVEGGLVCRGSGITSSPQNESIAFTSNVGDFITISENTGQAIRKYTVTSQCGDSIRDLDSFEACDGTELLGLTCSDFDGMSGSGLACETDCSAFDTSACYKTRYVATTGTDQGDCADSWAPCATVQYCIGNMSAGDTCTVADGTYTDVTNDSFMHFFGVDLDCTSATCTVTATNVDAASPNVVFTTGAPGNPDYGPRFNSVNNIEVIGFEFNSNRVMDVTDSDDITISSSVHKYGSTHTTTGDPTLAYVTGGSDRFTWQDSTMLPDTPYCDFVDDDNPKGFGFNGGTGHILQRNTFRIPQLGDIDNGADTVTIKRNIFEHVSEHGFTFNADAGAAPSDIVIENNILQGDPACSGTCADLKSNCAVVGNRILDIYDVDGLVFRNNTIAGHDYGFQSLVHTYKEAVQCGDDGDPGPCRRTDIKIYNNAVVDLADWADTYYFWIDASLTCNGGDEDGNACVTDSDCPDVNAPIDPEDCNGAIHTGPYFSDGNYYMDNSSGYPGAGAGANGWGALRPTDNDNINNCGASGDTSGQPTQVWADWQGCDAWGSDSNNDPASIYEPTYNTATLFTDYPNEDYSLPAGSALINTGVDGTDADGVARCATEDFNGATRTGTCDIGAFQAGTVSYYFNYDTGDDGKPCTLPQEPCQTIDRLNALLATASSGDVFYLARGQTWYLPEQPTDRSLDIPIGLEGVTITATGTGGMFATDKPVLSGAQRLIPSGGDQNGEWCQSTADTELWYWDGADDACATFTAPSITVPSGSSSNEWLMFDEMDRGPEPWVCDHDLTVQCWDDDDCGAGNECLTDSPHCSLSGDPCATVGAACSPVADGTCQINGRRPPGYIGARCDGGSNDEEYCNPGQSEPNPCPSGTCEYACTTPAEVNESNCREGDDISLALNYTDDWGWGDIDTLGSSTIYLWAAAEPTQVLYLTGDDRVIDGGQSTSNITISDIVLEGSTENNLSVGGTSGELPIGYTFEDMDCRLSGSSCLRNRNAGESAFPFSSCSVGSSNAGDYCKWDGQCLPADSGHTCEIATFADNTTFERVRCYRNRKNGCNWSGPLWTAGGNETGTCDSSLVCDTGGTGSDPPDNRCVEEGQTCGHFAGPLAAGVTYTRSLGYQNEDDGFQSDVTTDSEYSWNIIFQNGNKGLNLDGGGQQIDCRCETSLDRCLISGDGSLGPTFCPNPELAQTCVGECYVDDGLCMEDNDCKRCVGGTQAGDPCSSNTDCDSNNCGSNECHFGPNFRMTCDVDGDCPGGACDIFATNNTCPGIEECDIGHEKYASGSSQDEVSGHWNSAANPTDIHHNLAWQNGGVALLFEFDAHYGKIHHNALFENGKCFGTLQLALNNTVYFNVCLVAGFVSDDVNGSLNMGQFEYPSFVSNENNAAVHNMIFGADGDAPKMFLAQKSRSLTSYNNVWGSDSTSTEAFLNTYSWGRGDDGLHRFDRNYYATMTGNRFSVQDAQNGPWGKTISFTEWKSAPSACTVADTVRPEKACGDNTDCPGGGTCSASTTAKDELGLTLVYGANSWGATETWADAGGDRVVDWIASEFPDGNWLDCYDCYDPANLETCVFSEENGCVNWSPQQLGDIMQNMSAGPVYGDSGLCTGDPASTPCLINGQDIYADGDFFGRAITDAAEAPIGAFLMEFGPPPTIDWPFDVVGDIRTALYNFYSADGNDQRDDTTASDYDLDVEGGTGNYTSTDLPVDGEGQAADCDNLWALDRVGNVDDAALDLDPGDHFMFEAVVRLDNGVDFDKSYFAGKSGTSAPGWAFGIRNADREMYCAVTTTETPVITTGGSNDETDIRRASGVSVPDDDRWHHIACEFDQDADTLTFWIDGIEVSSVATTYLESTDASNVEDLTVLEWRDNTAECDVGIDIASIAITIDADTANLPDPLAFPDADDLNPIRRALVITDN